MVIITERGRAAAVMLSVEEYERSGDERQILRLLALNRPGLVGEHSLSLKIAQDGLLTQASTWVSILLGLQSTPRTT